MLALEIQEGKTAMDAKRARSGDTLIPSTSCVARLVSEIPPAPLGLRRIIVGDAWFTNVGTAVELDLKTDVLSCLSHLSTNFVLILLFLVSSLFKVVPRSLQPLAGHRSSPPCFDPFCLSLPGLPDTPVRKKCSTRVQRWTRKTLRWAKRSL